MHRELGLVLLVVSAQAQLERLGGMRMDMADMNGTCGAVWKSTFGYPVYISGNGSCTGVSLRLPGAKTAVAYVVKEETDGIAPGVYVQVLTGDVPGPRRQLADCHTEKPAAMRTLTGDEFVVACVNAAQTAVVAETFVGDAPGGGSFVVARTLADKITEPALAKLESEAAQWHNPVRSALRLTVSTSLCSARAPSPKITAFSRRSFVVSWLDHGANTTMRTRRCTADGTCDDLILDLYSGALLRYHSSTSRDYLAVYTVLHHSLNGWTMIARFAYRMELEGDPVPLAFLPNLSDLYTAQTVLMYGQGILVAWTGVDDSEEGINARLFLRNGTALGEMIEANWPPEGAQYHPHLSGQLYSSGNVFLATVVYSSLIEGEYTTYSQSLSVTFPPPPPTPAPPSPVPPTAAPPTQSPPFENTSAPSTATPATASPDRRDADDDDQLPPGAIVGIVVGVLAAVLVVAAAVVWFTRAPAQQSNGGGEEKQLPPAHAGKEMQHTEPAMHGPA
ncbi:hypothetical protein DIPPA_28356 [Diplonema papillatum]|nr:hypothetical protein DIPPA_28356 [Diplonema papillatum]